MSVDDRGLREAIAEAFRSVRLYGKRFGVTVGSVALTDEQAAMLADIAIRAIRDRGALPVIGDAERAALERVLAAVELARRWYVEGVRSRSGNVLLPERSPDVFDVLTNEDIAVLRRLAGEG